MLNCFFLVLLLANLLNCQLRATQLRSGVLTHASLHSLLCSLNGLFELEMRKKRFEKGRGHGGKNDISEETMENARKLQKLKH